MTTPGTVLYVAATEADATAGAAKLAETAPSLSTDPVVETATIRERAPDADCLVFAETPTTAPGSNLLEVIEAAGATPVVLFTDASYRPGAARSTDGIDGYVRRSDDAAFAHLADEIEWLAHGRTGEPGARPALAPGEVDDEAAGSIRVDPHGRIERVDDWVATLLEVEAAGLTGVTLETLATTGVMPSGDVEAILEAVDRVLEDPDETTTVESTVSPDGDVTVDVTVTVGAGEGTAVLDVRTGHADRSRDDAPESDPSSAERAASSDEPDAGAGLSALLDAVPEPVIRYEIAEGDTAARAEGDRERVPIVRATNAAFDAAFADGDGPATGEVVGDSLPAVDGRGAQSLHEALAAPGTRDVSLRPGGKRRREFRVHVRSVAADDDRDGAGYVAVLVDVTDRNRLERERRLLADRLDAIDADVRHDLRNALNLAQGYLDLRGETGDDDHLEAVAAAHDRLRAIADRLDDVTDREGATADTEPVAIHDIARRAWTGTDAADATLSFGEDAIVRADKVRLVELFEELFWSITRATAGTDANRDGADAPATDESIAIRVGATEAGFVVTVDDPADGTPLESESGDDPGSALVRRIADAHGWEVSISGSAGGETRVEFRNVDFEFPTVASALRDVGIEFREGDTAPGDADAPAELEGTGDGADPGRDEDWRLEIDI